MRPQGELEPGDKVHGQLFWTTGRSSTSEAASVSFEVPADGQMHEVRLKLAEHPRWRGRITSLRFDPCTAAGVKVVVLETVQGLGLKA